jgi:hypothetical protein
MYESKISFYQTSLSRPSAPSVPKKACKTCAETYVNSSLIFLSNKNNEISHTTQLMLFDTQLWEPEINLARAKFISGSQSWVSNSINCVVWLIDASVK